MREIIARKLHDNLGLDSLEVIDESHKHAGHGNFNGEGGTHFQLIIKSEMLSSLPRVKAHQKIYKILAAELASTVHALAIDIKKD